LFGIGLDNFRFAASDLLEKPSNWSDHGENYYITILSETGLVGGISILSLMAVLVYKILRRLFTEKNLVSIGISFAVLASSIHVVAAPDWYYLTIFLFFWLGTALILPVETPS
jgi:O-antigen ligase